jgi:hypothetical protein
MEPIGSSSSEKEVIHDGCKEEGCCKEAGREEGRQEDHQEEVVTSSVVF